MPGAPIDCRRELRRNGVAGLALTALGIVFMSAMLP